jgi:hypothetical protein
VTAIEDGDQADCRCVQVTGRRREGGGGFEEQREEEQEQNKKNIDRELDPYGLAAGISKTLQSLASSAGDLGSGPGRPGEWKARRALGREGSGQK